MALRYASCNCGSGALATEKRVVAIRVMGEYRDEERELPMCSSCADAHDREREANQPYTKEWHVRRVNQKASRLRAVVADWFEDGAEDMKATRRLRDEMEFLSRSLSADLAAIDAINYSEFSRSLS